jgi:hypothetical protein
MKILTETYPNAVLALPDVGQHIIAHQTETQLVVYQAYKPAIADFAVQNQYLGGAAFNYGRMSWIKPNFLWMMYRCGWASKENQERVLAFWLDKAAFEDHFPGQLRGQCQPEADSPRGLALFHRPEKQPLGERQQRNRLPGPRYA